jgi:hypothetical protein
MDDNKNKIIECFYNNVKNKPIIINKNINKNHDGKEGHWLEKQMGISPNNKNLPDLYGYEMKKNSNKITYGDWSATEYLFTNNKPEINHFNGWTENEFNITRNDFINFFGNPNPKKNNRYSWSGKCFPTYRKYNDCGQIIKISANNDICILYSYTKDKREIKVTYPLEIKKDCILIAYWNNIKLKEHVEQKFNNKGFFICKKNKYTKLYDKICFGLPFDFITFIKNFKNRNIILDSGMYIGNTRNYSSFRSNGNFWLELIVEEY